MEIAHVEEALDFDNLSVIPKYIETCEYQSNNGKAIAICSDGTLLVEDGAQDDKLLIQRFIKIGEREGFSNISVRVADRAELLVLLGRTQRESDTQMDEEKDNDAKATLERILAKAIKIRASDVHIRKAGADSCVYYRVDGMLTKNEPYSEALLSLAISRLINRDIGNIKEMSDDNSIENGTVNDYVIKVDGEPTKKELRLSKIPTTLGSKTVIRINDSNVKSKKLEDFKYDEDTLNFLKAEVSQSYGSTIVTGPTGSGKTNLLAAMTSAIDPSKERRTIEDPVEIKIPGVDQSTVIEGSKNATFEKLLKAMLRQDPDTLTLGEMRDAEAARQLLGFARTGHYTLSTLHVNCAALTPERLNDMGVDFSEMKSTLSSCIAVRLVPLLCPDCKLGVDEANLSKENRAKILRITSDLSKIRLINPLGCQKCSGLGVYGRQSVIEYIKIEESDFEWIERRNIYAWMRHLKETRNWRSMGDRARDIALQGIIDPLHAEGFVTGIFDI
ncbi:hypothetical protein GCM10011607_28640 [Shewanella inventionis]|uniref:Bacterial type II secretion system protein E domain-containing protein n=1 Tax=Shewanella inventionis TaxID=1738770 RepID=A0ABQ1JH77_9GAMM|nr:ATPase, T2SS/T4P/T4SS family [Shewanella inventionis]GGB66241.1 hypothetical protein GCM10011607_28640 [Shewanella inventionis]